MEIVDPVAYTRYLHKRFRKLWIPDPVLYIIPEMKETTEADEWLRGRWPIRGYPFFIQRRRRAPPKAWPVAVDEVAVDEAALLAR
jgi:hypothetical protein